MRSFAEYSFKLSNDVKERSFRFKAKLIGVESELRKSIAKKILCKNKVVTIFLAQRLNTLNRNVCMGLDGNLDLTK